MDKAPFSAFLLLLVGIVLLAQFVTGNLWTFLDGLLGTSSSASTPAPTGAPTSSKGAVGGTAGRTATYAGSSRSA